MAQIKGSLFERLLSSVVLVISFVGFVKYSLGLSAFHKRGSVAKSLEIIVEELPLDRRAGFQEVVDQYLQGEIEREGSLRIRLKELADKDALEKQPAMKEEQE